jgi:mannose-1-phosphate guanylyltransferase/mannose-6-phosphate isomerase
MKIVILAGGSGTRLWPLSRENFPKQFLKIPLSDSEVPESFFQKTIKRFINYPNAEIFIITNEKHKFYVLHQSEEVLRDLENDKKLELILEPVGKNTAPAIAFSIKYALENNKAGLDDIFFITPADHLITDTEKFLSIIKTAEALAKKGYIVTFGIKPTKPDTGYGYIKAKNKNGLFIVEKFTEKPALKKAVSYLKEGSYYWNSGMFAFKAGTMIEEFKKYIPELSKIFDKPFKEVVKTFHKLPNISIDYAVMEKTDRAVLLPVDIFWSDIGSWESLYEVFEKDKKANALSGEVITIDTKGSLIIGNKRLIATIGIEDLIVIETEDALLIAKKGDAQKVKELVKILSEKGYPQVKDHVTSYRPWGSFTLLEKGMRYKIKKIVVKPKETLSLQMHHHRSEHWIVVKGTAKVVIGDKEQFVHENESVYVPKSTLHRLENPGKLPLEIIEVQVGEYVEEDDIKRFEDIYGRQDI